MGITRPAGLGESVKNVNSKEICIDCQTNRFLKLLGVGDMAGDVFGNGMLYIKPYVFDCCL